MTGYILCALFVTAGLFILMDVRPRDVTDRLKKPFEKEVNRKMRIRRITGKKPSTAQRMMEEAVTMLAPPAWVNRYPPTETCPSCWRWRAFCSGW